MTINLRNLNERPFFSSGSLRNPDRTYPEGRTSRLVATYAATEPDGGPIDWYVYGTDADHFTIDNGALRFVNVPDFEDKQDGFDANDDGDFLDTKDDPTTDQVERDVPRDNYYDITVRATERTAIGDGPSLSADLDVVVEVTDRDEPGTVMLEWLQPEVGTPIGVVLTDPDQDADTDPPIVIESYAWYRSKVANPDPTPDIDDQLRFRAEWEDLGWSKESYKPEGDTDDNIRVMDEGRYLLALLTYHGGTQAAGISRYPVRQNVLPEDNGSPDFRDNERPLEVPETTAVGGAVGTVIVDEEPDDDTLTYELVALGGDELTEALNPGSRDGDDPNNVDVKFFEIDPATGEVTVKKMLSYEEDDDRDYTGTGDDKITAGEYKFIVRATDPSGEGKDDGVTPHVYRDSDEITITVMAAKANEAPEVTEGQADLTIDEANSRKKDDEKPNYFINLGLQLSNGEDSKLVFDPASLNLYKDKDADSPDNPNWTLEGTDSGWFALGTPDHGIGRRLLFKTDFEPDFENPSDANQDNVYEVTVVVHDSSDVSGKQDVRVEVMNVREEEKLTLTPAQPYFPGDQSTVTAELTDYDGVISYTYWQWYWTNTDTDLVFVDLDDPATSVDDRDEVNLSSIQGRIVGANAATYVASEEDIGRYLHVVVEYRDGWSLLDNPAASSPEDERNIPPDKDYATERGLDDQGFAYDSDEMLTARTDNAVQTDPTDTTGPGPGPDPDPDPTDPTDLPISPVNPTTQSFRTTVAENTPGSGYVGATVQLIAGLVYVPSGPDAKHFVLADKLVDRTDAVNPTSDVYASNNIQRKPGQLAVALSPVVAQLDYEAGQNSYTFEMTAKRDSGQEDIIMVEIVVEDVNEAPSAPEKGTVTRIAGWNRVNREEGDSLDVATYRIVGADADQAVWMPLAGTDADIFDFDAGVLTFKAAPDFEMPLNQNTHDDTYLVTIEAQPQGDDVLPISKEVQVIIRNVEEPGTVTLSTVMPLVDGEITATLADPDGDVTDLLWQWASSDDMDGTFTDIADATASSYTPRGAVVDDPETTDDETDAGDMGVYLRATAMYDDGHGSDKNADAVTANTVGVIPDQDGVVTLSPSQPQVGSPLTADLTDDDVVVMDSLTWQWASSDAMGGTFTDIADATASSYTPVEGDVGMYLQATANYNDGHGDGKSAMMVTGNAVIAADTCIERLGALTGPQTVMGAWANDCGSEARTGSNARYYSFTLDSDTQVEMNLTAPVDAYLALRQGAGRDGVIVAFNDNVGSRNPNSAINEMLAAGTYTVEATTFFAGQTGDFTLSVRPLQETEDLGTLAGSVDRSNSMWVSDYVSTQQAGSYARSYTFTVNTATHVAINLTSPEDAYLYVLDSNGAAVHENDNVTTRNLNSRIDETLPAGMYTIEATTYFPARMGTFHLSIGVLR